MGIRKAINGMWANLKRICRESTNRTWNRRNLFNKFSNILIRTKTKQHLLCIFVFQAIRFIGLPYLLSKNWHKNKMRKKKPEKCCWRIHGAHSDKNGKKWQGLRGQTSPGAWGWWCAPHSLHHLAQPSVTRPISTQFNFFLLIVSLHKLHTLCTPSPPMLDRITQWRYSRYVNSVRFWFLDNEGEHATSGLGHHATGTLPRRTRPRDAAPPLCAKTHVNLS